MSNGRVSIFIAGVLVVAAAGTAVHFYTKCQRVEDERRLDAKRIRDLQSELNLVRAEVSEYQEKLREAKQIADEIERERDAKERLAREHAAKIDELEAKLAAMTAPPPPEQPTVVALVEGATPAAEEANTEPAVATAASSNDESPGELHDAKASRPGAETARSDLERELDEVRAEKRELEIKHAALVGERAEGVPLGKVRVATGLRLKGKVLLVNDRYNFVVIDLGARDGVEKGMVLILHRGRKFIGKCQVLKVYNNKAAADLVLDWMKDEVQVGDGVRKF